MVGPERRGRKKKDGALIIDCWITSRRSLFMIILHMNGTDSCCTSIFCHQSHRIIIFTMKINFSIFLKSKVIIMIEWIICQRFWETIFKGFLLKGISPCLVQYKQVAQFHLTLKNIANLHWKNFERANWLSNGQMSNLWVLFISFMVPQINPSL